MLQTHWIKTQESIVVLGLEGHLGLENLNQGPEGDLCGIDEPRILAVSCAGGLCGFLDQDRLVEELQSVPSGPPSFAE